MWRSDDGGVVMEEWRWKSGVEEWCGGVVMEELCGGVMWFLSFACCDSSGRVCMMDGGYRSSFNLCIGRFC